MFDRRKKKAGETGTAPEARLRAALAEAETVVIGAGAGMSTSAGFIYTGERFDRYFSDFAAKYHFSDMYSGGFYVLRSAPEEMWVYWSRNIWVNRYMPVPNDTYDRLHDLVEGKDCFVITTNVDHCFQRSGFDKQRLFYTQGDYGLFQCSLPCHASTYDNRETVRAMAEAQGFRIGADGTLTAPEPAALRMTVPSGLIPRCPRCGRPMTMNLRSDDTFVEDEGWHAAAGRYRAFLESRRDRKTLFLELGVGHNTPVFYVLNPIRPKMAKNSRFYPENGYFMKELSRITDSERLRRCA